MTAVAGDLDLDRWVTFAGEPSEACDGMNGPCSREPAVVAIWDRPCLCDSSLTRYCAEHRDFLVAFIGRPGFVGFECAKCACRIRLLRIEPIR
jgi:hypothetical protein